MEIKREQYKSQFNNLQGLRFFAFLLIFLNHSYWYLGISKVFDYGARGVEIFFVLSGYLVAYNYCDKEIGNTFNDSVHYVYKKLKKFYVLHIVTFVCFFITPLKKFIKGVMTEQQSQKFIVDTILNITLLKSWWAPSMFSFNGVTWFLSTILFAYLLVPQLVNFFKRRSNKFYVCSLVFVIVMKMALDTWGYKTPHHFWFPVSFYTNPAYRFMDFLLGYLLFINAKSYGECLNKKLGSLFQFVVFWSYIVCCFMFDKLWVPCAYLLITILVIYVCTIEDCILDKLLGNKICVYLGGISFELFILHVLMIKVCKKLNHFLDGCFSNEQFWLFSLTVSIIVSVAAKEKIWRRLIPIFRSGV